MRPAGLRPWQRARELRAVREVSFELDAGETIGIVGESGSGKSTLARALIGTIPAAGGQALWRGEDLLAMSPAERHRRRRDIQMIFQDPLAALDPRMTASEIVAEPLATHEPALKRTERRALVAQMIERVGLLPDHLDRYPHEFSGGQCQRIAIARALVSRPRLVICDEPVSALDVSVQAQIVNLLYDLRRELDLALIFIAHDLSVVKHISDRIMVFYLGRALEYAPARDLVRAPSHPYTRALIAAAPIPDPAVERGRIRAPLGGEVPSPLVPPSGCAFRTRCAIARQSCAGETPAMQEYAPGHFAACPFGASLDTAPEGPARNEAMQRNPSS
ncbi:MAG: ATP-binding cassette domain-containing protein [Defluviicoccus sp.]|nr:ATP-binding cassette domain-containing protein [Defluviicoccus sp.]MDE0382841.1 ATP-binding cassette domain-containing protein [Defluviicoccus sp.]